MKNNLLLAIDAGNSDITFGLFENENLIKKFRIKSDKNYYYDNYEKIFNEYLNNLKINDFILASVNESINNAIAESIYKKFKKDILIFDINTCTGMPVLTENPQKTGVDRLANAYAVKNIGHLPAIIVDVGTAITFDILSTKGEFIGGIIMPGINMQLKSLHNSTNKLPQIEIENINNTIGNSTKNAILSGVIKGTANAIDGLILECTKELEKKPIIYATGGQGEFISAYMKQKFDYINPNLTLYGLMCYARRKGYGSLA